VEADFGADRQQLNIRAARTYIDVDQSEDPPMDTKTDTKTDTKADAADDTKA
jgi:hypothetical protein